MNRTYLPAIFVAAAIALAGCGSSNSSTTSADNTTTAVHTQTATTPATTTPGHTTTQPSTGSKTSTQPANGTHTSTQPAAGTHTSTGPTTTTPTTHALAVKEIHKAFLAKVNTICLTIAKKLSKAAKFGMGPAAIYAKVTEAYGSQISQMEKVTPPSKDAANFRVYLRELKLQGQVYPRLNLLYVSHDPSVATREALERRGEHYSKARRAAAKRMGADGCDK